MVLVARSVHLYENRRQLKEEVKSLEGHRYKLIRVMEVGKEKAKLEATKFEVE